MDMADDEEQMRRLNGSAGRTDEDAIVHHPHGVAADAAREEHITCPPWKGTLAYTQSLAKISGHGHGTGLFVLKWCLPAFCFCVASFTCMWFLHVGTYYYVHEMEFKEAVFVVNTTRLAEFPYATGTNGYLSAGVNPTDTSYGSLQDQISASLGWKAINMHSLDMISAVLPVTWFFATILTDDLQHWTKMLICNVFLALGKGVFGFMTVVPDSIGWNSCKERLKPEGIARLKAGIGEPTIGFTKVFWNTLAFEVKLVWGKLTGGKGIRFCGDMLYSGHTFFTTLYALGLVELTRTHLRRRHSMPEWQRTAIVACVYALAIGEQITEIYLVLLNRFHYSMDVFMAILLTFLFFTNGSITIAAKIWYHWSGDFTGGNVHVEDAKRARANCHPEDEKIFEWADRHKDEYALIPKSQMQSAGDTWTPVCCVPFCCISGRYHIVDDHTFNAINGTNEDSDYVMESDSEVVP